MNSLKYIFLGSTSFSQEVLLHLMSHGYIPELIFTMPKAFKISYSDTQVVNRNFFDLSSIAEEMNIPCYEIGSKNGKKLDDYIELIQGLNVDVIVVAGWYYMLTKSVRNSVKNGAWGVHASLLPRYAGGAPLTWAIINGEKEAGVTLFRLEDGVDDGDIIMQKSFSIEHEDSIKQVYEKATQVTKEIIIDAFNRIDSLNYIPQDKSRIEVYPQRNPDDGEIDLSKPSIDIYNFIRAQSAPYPGAFIRTIDGKKLILEKARIE
ncbi:MAG: methionyl-tRNA formyltransferase [Francisellaceae bacterium]